MRRLLLALALMAGLAARADAQLIVVTHCGDRSFNGGYGADRSEDAAIRELTLARIPFVQIAYPSIARTDPNGDSLRCMSVNIYGNVWRRYDAVLLPGYKRGVSTLLDNLTTVAKAPRGPVLFMGDQTNSNAISEVTGACSSGVGNGIASSAALNSAGLVFRPGMPWVWHPSAGPFNLLGAAGAVTVPAGIFRVLLGEASSNNIGAGAPSDIDGIVFRNLPDTVVMGMRVFQKAGTATRLVLSMAGGTDTASVCIFWNQTTRPIQYLHEAIAVADSFVRGALLRGVQARPAAAYLPSFGNYSTGDAGFIPADSAGIKASLDSLAALRVPIGVPVAPESLVAKPWQIAWINRMPMAYVMLSNRPITGAAVPALTSKALPYDPFGAARNRQAYDDAVCGDEAADTSIACDLVYGFKILTDRFGEQRVSRILAPSSNDWLPPIAQVSGVGGTMGSDSLFAAMAFAGATGVVNGSRQNLGHLLNAPLEATTSGYYSSRMILTLPHGGSSSGGVRANFTANPITASTAALPAAGRSFRIYLDPANFGVGYVGGWLDNMNKLTALYDPAIKYQSGAGVDIAGSYIGDLVDRAPYLGAQVASLRPGYYEIKWLVHSINMVNASCWPGNRMLEMRRLDEFPPLRLP